MYDGKACEWKHPRAPVARAAPLSDDKRATRAVLYFLRDAAVEVKRMVAVSSPADGEEEESARGWVGMKAGAVLLSSSSLPPSPWGSLGSSG